MHTHLTEYYIKLRKALIKHAGKVAPQVPIEPKVFLKTLPKLRETVDAKLFPCLISKNCLFYLVTKYDLKHNNFSHNIIIPITKTLNIVILK